MATKGFAAPEVERVYTRARELCQQVGETPQLFPVLWGLWHFIMCGASSRRRASWGSNSSAWPRRSKTRLFSWRPTWRWEVSCSILGEFALAQEHLEQGLPSTTPSAPLPCFPLRTGPRGEPASMAARALWLLGYPDQASRRAMRRLPWPRSCLIPSAWLLPYVLLPCLISSAGREH